MPQFDVDVGDDGVLDGSGSLSSVVLTTQPYRIRITAQGFTSSVVGQVSNFLAGFTLDVTPVNNINIIDAVQGCGPDAYVHESFEGMGVQILSPVSDLVVVGFAAQPTLLPNMSQSPFPCLLYPQPDVVVLLPFEGVTVPIPLAARPINFFLQAVDVVSGGDLRTTQGFLINAN